MKIKFLKLRVQNFKCYKDKVIEFGEKTLISGRNGVGKSTIADAVNWILFDKLADGTKADKIRPHDINGVNTDFIDIVAELDIEVDGKPINIVKTQKQKWTKPRGKTEQRFDGNYNEYIVNTIPKTETEFKKYFETIINEELFRFTSNASAFLKLKTAERRSKLFELVSDLTDEDVIASNPKLFPVKEMLENYTLEELMSRCNKAIKDNNNEIELIPARIDEISKLKVVVDVAELELQKNALKEQIADVEKQLSNTEESAKMINKLSDEIMQTQFSINDVKRKANEELFAKRDEIEKQIVALEEKQATTARKRTLINREVENLTQKIADNESIVESCKTEFAAENAKVFDELVWKFDESPYTLGENEKICPTCGREYEQSSIAEKQVKLEERKASARADFEKRKESAKADFEANKTKAIESIKNKGNNAYTVAKADKESLTKSQAEFEQIKADIVSLNAQRNELENKLAELPKEVDLTGNKEIADLELKLVNLNATYDGMKNSDSVYKDLENKKSGLQNEINEVQKKIDSADNSNIDERIEELKLRQKSLAQLVANAQKEQDLLDEFNRAKVNMLTDKINEHFSLIKWKLFGEQVNGGFKEMCEPTYKGTEYKNGLNAGHKILAELDIVNTLQKIYEVSVPVFLDNSERLSSNNIPKLDCQLISLCVSDDKELKVEVK